MLTLQDYTLQQEIGRGTHSTIYQAVETLADGSTSQPLALKCYPENFLSEPHQQQLFNNRASIVSYLNHPSLVPVLAHAIQNGRPYLTMPLMENGSLQELLQATKSPLTIAEIGTILTRIAAALDALHEQELLHRNITPNAILFDGEANPWLAGVEIAPLPDVGALTLLRDSNMNPNYLAPEQLQRQPSTAQTDIYALTAVLYHLLTGTPPYSGDTPLTIAYKHLNDPIPDLPHDLRYAQFQTQLDRIIRRGMAKQAEDRPETAGQLAAQFLEATQQPAVADTPDEPEPTPEPEEPEESVTSHSQQESNVPPPPPYSSKADHIFDPEADAKRTPSPFVIFAIIAVALTCMLTILGASLGAVVIQRMNPVATNAFPTLSANSTAVPNSQSITDLPASGSAPDSTSSGSQPPQALNAPLNTVRSTATNPTLDFIGSASSFSSADSGWHLYGNGNTVHDVAYFDDKVFAATGSGLTIADLNTDELTRLTAFDGLPSNSLTAVAVCNLPDPQLLIGTDNGLAFIDLTTGSLEISDSWQAENRPLASNKITALACSPSGSTPKIYIGHDDDGVNIYTPSTQTWESITRDSHNLRVDRAYDIAVSADALWIAHSYALSRYDLNTREVTIFEEDNNNIPSDSVRAVAIAPDSGVWLATIDGLVRGDGQGEWTLFDEQESANVPGGVGESVHVDREGQVWFGTSSGRVCHFDPAQETCAETYAFQGETSLDNDISSITTSADGRIFVGHAQIGIQAAPISFPITEFSWQAYRLDGQLFTNSVTALAESGSSMWIGTTRGLYQTDLNDTSGTSWRGYQAYSSPLPSTWINDLIADGRGGVWAATSQGAAHITADHEITTFLSGLDVETALRDTQERVWLGTDEGVYVWNGSELLDLRDWNGLPATDVATMGLNGNDIWIAYQYDTVARISGNEVTIFNDETLEGVYFYAQEDIVSAGGEVYLISGRTLLRAENNTFVELLSLDSIIESLHYHEPSDTLLLGTWYDGLFTWRNGQLTQISTAEGLPSSYITAIHIDSLGSLWIGGNSFSPHRHGGVGRYIP